MLSNEDGLTQKIQRILPRLPIFQLHWERQGLNSLIVLRAEQVALYPEQEDEKIDITNSDSQN